MLIIRRRGWRYHDKKDVVIFDQKAGPPGTPPPPYGRGLPWLTTLFASIRLPKWVVCRVLE